MPTDLRRTQVTHTGAVQRALEVAGRRWPGERPSALLVHLIEEGARAIERDRDVDLGAHRARIAAAAGRHDEFYEAGYLAREREGWEE